MDYALEYALMSDIYDEMTEANEGFFGNIGSALKRFWRWLIEKVTDFIDRLFKRKKKTEASTNSTSSKPTPSPKFTTATQIEKVSKYGAGRDKDNKPYTRVDSDPNRIGEATWDDVSSGHLAKRRLEESLKQQINQMNLHTYRLTDNICAAEISLESFVTKIGKTLSNDDKEDHLENYFGLASSTDELIKNTEELDAFIIGLNEMLDEYKESGGDMATIHTYTNRYINTMIAKLNNLKKSSTNILSVISNNTGKITGKLSEQTEELTKATSNAIKVTEKVIAIFEKI